MAAQGLSLAVVSGAVLWLGCTGFTAVASLLVELRLQGTRAPAGGHYGCSRAFSSCGLLLVEPGPGHTGSGQLQPLGL